MAEVAAKVAAAKGLKIKIVEFSDYGHVNEALAAKDIDVNAFQHVPYLNKAIAQKGYPFTPLGKTVLFPLGVYSLKIHSVNEITDGMLVTVPADPANLGRALQLLERNGLITLRAGTGVHATAQHRHSLRYSKKQPIKSIRSFPSEWQFPFCPPKPRHRFIPVFSPKAFLSVPTEKTTSDSDAPLRR